MANEFIIRKGFKSQEDSQITGSISLSGSFKDQENSPGTSGQVLSSTVSGSQWVDIEDPDAVTGTGTVGTIPKWATTTSLGNSIITEAASAITVGGAATFSGAVNVIDAYANDPLIKLATNTSGNAEVQIRTATTSYNPGIGVVTSGYNFNIFTENTPRLTISSGGSLLVKTTATSGIGNGDIGLDNGALRGGIIRARNAADNAYKALIYLDQNDAVQVGTAATGLNISSAGNSIFSGNISLADTKYIQLNNTSTDWQLRADNAGRFVVQTSGGSEFFKISSTGYATFSNYIDTPEVRQGGEFMIGRSSNIIRVGSGDASDSLAFYAGGSQAMSISSGGDATFQSDANKVTINSTNSTQATLEIGRSVDTKAKITSGDVSANDLNLYTLGSRKLSIGSNWASNLDAYEENTYQPTLFGGTTAGTNPPVGAGDYTVIGNVCHLTIRFNNATLTNASGALTIDLPFAAKSGVSGQTSGNINVYNLPFSTTDMTMMNCAGANIYGLVSRNNTTWIDWNLPTGVNTGIYINFSVTYLIN